MTAQFDVATLRRLHPALLKAVADHLALGARVALSRRYESPCELVVDVEGREARIAMQWKRVRRTHVAMVDQARATEDGAEAVALGIIHLELGCTLVRRTPRGDRTDWLIRDLHTGEELVLEVAGIDSGSVRSLARVKAQQAALSPEGLAGIACAVRFDGPTATVLRVWPASISSIGK